MAGNHEFRDPIHGFIHVDDAERRVIDSKPMQRLRQIHQLATSYLIYPGASHKRFEHSLGVMDLAGRVFDAVLNPKNIHRSLPQSWRELANNIEDKSYWRKSLRIAALSHDVGHLPFSHASENELLPPNRDGHEHYTYDLIHSGWMSNQWNSPPLILESKDIAMLAVGPQKFFNEPFGELRGVLSEIITGGAFGVDRMDYLLRDSHHLGVAYGKFDHARLIECLRILPPPFESNTQTSNEPQLGVTHDGIHAAEALVLARYFMYQQVYFHRVRRIYDLHLKDFTKTFLEERFTDGLFPDQIEEFLGLTDSEILAAINLAASNTDAPGHDPASRLTERRHFRVLWQYSPSDIKANANIGEAIFQSAQIKFGNENIRRDHYAEKGAGIDFPVLMDDGMVVSARSVSQVLERLPIARFDFVYVEPAILKDARKWLNEAKPQLLEEMPREEEEV